MIIARTGPDSMLLLNPIFQDLLEDDNDVQ